MEYKHYKTNLEKENEYPKLVRDRIPELIKERTEKDAETSIIEKDNEYLRFLLKKVEEEANELANAEGKEHVVEEVADIKELLDTILSFQGLDWETVGNVQKEKAEKNGGFQKRILMMKNVD